MINYQLLLILRVQKSKSSRPKPGRIDIFSSGHVHSIFGVSLDLLGKHLYHKQTCRQKCRKHTLLSCIKTVE